VFWDSNGDGTNESSATSDDPATPEVGDPTVLLIGAIPEIPTLGFGGLVLLSVLLLGVVSSRLRGARW
ncbi:MAG: hypothetical protein K8J08_21550, partial [Thermoanaerobaculia bacterium]|nr:hypothetical protein [Thermoanaerobaculia bacterium]